MKSFTLYYVSDSNNTIIITVNDISISVNNINTLVNNIRISVNNIHISVNNIHISVNNIHYIYASTYQWITTCEFRSFFQGLIIVCILSCLVIFVTVLSSLSKLLLEHAMTYFLSSYSASAIHSSLICFSHIRINIHIKRIQNYERGLCYTKR